MPGLFFWGLCSLQTHAPLTAIAPMVDVQPIRCIPTKISTGNGANDLKSYILEGLSDSNAASEELSSLLPGQIDPWLLLTKGDDPIAYFNLDSPRDFEDLQGPFSIVADISGRHYNEDDAVVRILRSIQEKLGGQIRDDDDNLL